MRGTCYIEDLFYYFFFPPPPLLCETTNFPLLITGDISFCDNQGDVFAIHAVYRVDMSFVCMMLEPYWDTK